MNSKQKTIRLVEREDGKWIAEHDGSPELTAKSGIVLSVINAIEGEIK